MAYVWFVESYPRSGAHHRYTCCCNFLLLQKLDEQQAALWAATVWSIWKHHNLKLWKNVTETTTHIFERAKHMIEDWRLANTMKPEQIVAGSNRNTSGLLQDNKAVGNLEVQFAGRNLKTEGINVMLMLLFLIIEIVLVLACVFVMMRAVLCSQKQCGLHLFAMWK
jgi:hypothetical protein